MHAPTPTPIAPIATTRGCGYDSPVTADLLPPAEHDCSRCADRYTCLIETYTSRAEQAAQSRRLGARVRRWLD